jgi:hypothetical protein
MKALTINGMFLAALVAGVFMLIGCAHDSIDLKQLTTLSVDCETDEVKISDDTVALNGEETWTAKCNKKTYSCNYLSESDLGCYENEK